MADTLPVPDTTVTVVPEKEETKSEAVAVPDPLALGTSASAGLTTTDATTTEGATTSEGTSKKKKKGKKGKKSRSGSRKKRKGKKKKSKKKKKGKKSKSDSQPKSSPERDTGPKYTDEDIQSYIQKREKHKAKVKQQKLLHRMKELISIVSINDPRWNQWTEQALKKFINDPNIDVVTVFFEKVVEKKAEKKLLWAIGEEEHAKKLQVEEEEHESKTEETPETATMIKGKSSKPFREPSIAAVDPFHRFDNEPDEDTRLGPPPPFIGTQKLMVLNEAVPNTSPDLFYFVKFKNVALTNDNFFESCLFGNAPGSQLTSLQLLLTHVFTPIFYQPGVLPDSIRNEFSASLNKFMASATETTNRLQNQTMLYVPIEVLDIPVDIASRDKELCSRLEDTMIHWVRQIKEVLSSQSFIDMDDWSGPLQELKFWENRCEDLAGLTAQIRSQSVRTVRDIMQIVKSPYVQQFNRVAAEILECSAEAMSNLHYLNALREPCEILHDSKVKDIPGQLQNLLWLVRVIWLNAPFYNTRDKLNGLMRKISNELIRKCVEEIDVEKVFNGYIDASEITLKSCLDCLLFWKEKYMEAQKMHSMNSDHAWLLEYDKIFTHVDAFVQRIRDLLEIATCQKLYARRADGKQEELPLYPGTKAPDLTKTMKKVQKLFDKQLEALYNHSHIILDVRNGSWHIEMAQFKSTVKDIDIMVQNALTAAFEVPNIEQGLLLMECFYSFYQRELITRAYDMLTVKLFKLFDQEVSIIKGLYSKNILPLPLQYPQLAGRGSWACYLKRRLDMNYELLQNAWWLPECGFGDDVISQYKSLSTALGDFTNSMYQLWVEQLGTKDLTHRLEIPLMIRSTYKPGMLEVNFDKILYAATTEAEIWARMEKEIPVAFRTVYFQRDRLHKLRETVLLVVKDYNRIVAALSTEERNLFNERIKLLDRKVYPGLTRLTWSSDVSDSYINDCRQTANKVQGYVNDYKQANIKIGKLAMKITSYVLIKLDPKVVFPGLEFNEFQTKHREKAILKIATRYKNITVLLRSVYQMFREDGAEVNAQWLKFLSTIDEVIKEAMCINIRRSLEILNCGVHGDHRGPPPPIFKLDVIVSKENELGFSPSIPEVTNMILGIYPTICITMRPFPRVIQFLSDPKAEIASFSSVMENDEEAKAIQELVSSGVTNCIKQVEKYLKLWIPFKDVWEMSKDEFMSQYEAQNPSVRNFEMDIERYTEIINAVQGQESIVTIIFCVLDCTKIKDKIVQECKHWQDRFLNLLYDLASTRLLGYFKYIADWSKKFDKDKEPENLKELIITMRRLRLVQAEVVIKENDFPLMFEQFDCLKKYSFDIGEYTTGRVAAFPEEWATFLDKLKDMEEMVKVFKEKFA